MVAVVVMVMTMMTYLISTSMGNDVVFVFLHPRSKQTTQENKASNSSYVQENISRWKPFPVSGKPIGASNEQMGQLKKSHPSFLPASCNSNAVMQNGSPVDGGKCIAPPSCQTSPSPRGKCRLRERQRRKSRGRVATYELSLPQFGSAL